MLLHQLQKLLGVEARRQHHQLRQHQRVLEIEAGSAVVDGRGQQGARSGLEAVGRLDQAAVHRLALRQLLHGESKADHALGTAGGA
ncbi:hypothetical protein D3C81_1943390 [compost metagenome]